MIVKYSKKFPYAPYLNEDIGFEMEITNGADPLAALAELKEFAEKFHKENNPQLDYTNDLSKSSEWTQLPQGQQPIPIKDISEERVVKTFQSDDEIINQIWECDTIEQVAQWKYFANRSEETKKAYLNKLKQFV